MTEPTHLDRENARRRQEIADRQKAEYEVAEALTVSLFGPGWIPHGRYSLVTHAEAERSRRDGGRAAAAATVITAKNAANEARHFIVKDGNAREVESYQAAFGAMLTEPDTSRTIEVRGQSVHPHLYQLHWSGFEPDYAPKTAEQLAEAREKREGKAAAKWKAEVEKAATGSLFPDFVREQAAEERKKGRGPR